MNIHLKILLTLATLFHTTLGSSQEKLVIAINQNSLPASAIKAILQQAYTSIGLAIEFKEIPDRRSVVYANDGIADAEGFRVKGIDEKFRNLVPVHVPIRIDDLFLYVKKGKEFEVNGFESIPKNYVVGYRRGVLLAENEVKEHNLEHYELTTVDQIGRHLVSGRSDVVVLGKIGNDVFDKLGAKGVLRLEPPVHRAVFYHYVHKRYKHIVPALEAALKEMHMNGELAKINGSI